MQLGEALHFQTTGGLRTGLAGLFFPMSKAFNFLAESLNLFRRLI